MGDVILLLRGHVRDSFKDAELFNFVKKLCDLYTVTIYMHTWNIYSSDYAFIIKSNITDYFLGIKGVIKSIEIENDGSILLVGDETGNLFSTRILKIGWKRMWYGIYKTALKIKNDSKLDGSMNIPLLYSGISGHSSIDTALVINMRFDLFNNYNLYNNEKELLEFINNNIDKSLYENQFLRDSKNLIDIDNFYIGSIDSMYRLSQNFHNNLDFITSLYSKIYYQEAVVYYENTRLFSNGSSNNNDNMDLYIINSQDDIEYDIIIEKKRNIFYTNNLHMQRKEENVSKIFNLTQLIVKDPPLMRIKPVIGTNWRGFGKNLNKTN